MSKQYTILVVGDEGMGKSAYIKRLTTGVFLTEHKSTKGLATTECKFYTTEGVITLNLVECPPSAKVEDLKADGAIVLFDIVRTMYAAEWLNKLPTNMPVVFCRNKSDHMIKIGRGWYLMMTTFIHQCQKARPEGFVYYDLSALSNYNLEKPTLYLMRQLTNCQKLAYTKAI
jgi:GTP-binding nuclear protein Ran